MIGVDLIYRHLWAAFVLVSVVSSCAWWPEARHRVRSDPALEPGYRRLCRGYLFWTNVPWLLMGLGVASGLVPSSLDFANPSTGNVFVVLWWVAMYGLLALASYWMLAAGGAELLERHPGIDVIPHWPAPKLRRLWLGIVVFNVVMLVWTLLQPGEPPSRDSLFWLLSWILFTIAWILACAAFSALGGWRALADHHVAQSPFSGRRFRFRSARLARSIGYRGCLTLGASPEGLHLEVLPLFRTAHPPLLIPWSDITAREVRQGRFAIVELALARPPGFTIRISRDLAQALLAASAAPVGVEPSPRG
jgi:hypothetical protein